MATSCFCHRPLSLTFPSLAPKSNRDNQRFFSRGCGIRRTELIDWSTAILVVGTTDDPATPYRWAVALASGLDKGVLVGRVGVDHVAYYYSACVRQIDARYLIDGTTPPPSTVCPT